MMRFVAAMRRWLERACGTLIRPIAVVLDKSRFQPHDARGYLIRVWEYRVHGKYDLAINDLTEAIRLLPTYANAYSNRGLAYELKGDQERAAVDFAKAKELKDGS